MVHNICDGDWASGKLLIKSWVASAIYISSLLVVCYFRLIYSQNGGIHISFVYRWLRGRKDQNSTKKICSEFWIYKILMDVTRFHIPLVFSSHIRKAIIRKPIIRKPFIRIKVNVSLKSEIGYWSNRAYFFQ